MRKGAGSLNVAVAAGILIHGLLSGDGANSVTTQSTFRMSYRTLISGDAGGHQSSELIDLELEPLADQLHLQLNAAHRPADRARRSRRW